MRTSATAGPARGAAVTALGWLTAAWGTAYAVVGVSLLLAAPEAARVERVRGHGWGWLVDAVVVLLYGAGIASVLLGGLGVAAGVGVLYRRRWGRLLGYAVAGLALLLGVLWGWVWLGDRDAIDLALGLGQILYGLLAIVVLARNGAVFSPGPPRRWRDEAVGAPRAVHPGGGLKPAPGRGPAPGGGATAEGSMRYAASLLVASLSLCGVGVGALVAVELLDKGHRLDPRKFSAQAFLLASPFAGVAAAAVWWRAHRWVPAAAVVVAGACLGLILWGTVTDHVEWSRTPPGREVMHLGGFIGMTGAWALCLGLVAAGVISWGVRRRDGDAGNGGTHRKYGA